MTTVRVEYDCGMVVEQFAALKPDQTLLGNAALGDTLLAQADHEHDVMCRTCD